FGPGQRFDKGLAHGVPENGLTEQRAVLLWRRQTAQPLPELVQVERFVRGELGDALIPHGQEDSRGGVLDDDGPTATQATLDVDDEGVHWVSLTFEDKD